MNNRVTHNRARAQRSGGGNSTAQAYSQTGGGGNNPQVLGGGTISMGSSSGAINNFNNEGNSANKQIQGVNGGNITM